MEREAQARVREVVEAFAGNGSLRSVALRSLRGIPVSVEVRADVQAPAASLLKVPLVSAVHAAAATGQVDLDARVPHRRLGSTVYASVLDALDPDHELSVRELCALCLVTSDNPIAQFLLDLVGMEAVNRRAHQLGCRDTRMEVGFEDANLADAGRRNVTTARDAVALVSRFAADEPLIVDALASNLRNTRIPLRLPPDVRVAHKSGSLPHVANDAGVIFGETTDLAVVFLCDGEPDTARTGVAIGDCVARVWSALGERVEAPAGVL